jgi:hypothetical protein
MRPFRASVLPAVLALAALGAECPTSNPEVICTADFRYGLNVTVVDSLTGALVPRPILIVASEGAFSDTAKFALQTDGIQLGSWPLLGERSGVFTVLVRAPGYQDWQQSSVRIGRDACHVIPVALTARLRRS